MDTQMDKKTVAVPLSQSNVSLKLADIQKRCSELLDAPDNFGGLSLEEAPAVREDWIRRNPATVRCR